VLIDKEGEIQDQLAISSHMPNFCSVSFPNDDTLKQVISRAEEKDLMVAVVHNHPSGNVEASDYDKTLTEILERIMKPYAHPTRFAGHIILDHDSFNLYSVQSGKWETVTPMVAAETDRLTQEKKTEWADLDVCGTSALKRAARKINDTNNWNDDFIPVAFTNADRNISAIQYYSKDFFNSKSEDVRLELELSAKEAGAVSAFPVVTDALWNKLTPEEQQKMDATMKNHVQNNAFTDAAISTYTTTEKWNLNPGKNFYSDFRNKSEQNPEIKSTWEPEINNKLFPDRQEEKKHKRDDIER
ncbi:MAG: hypothetical protein HUK25_05080, partial [Treponema sp.]|nr:hypothetical protein [Treponema sp.]